MTVNIYTDGAYSSKTKVGGWAFIVQPEQFFNTSATIQYIQQNSKHNYELNTTNNRMELTALLQALQYIDTNAHYLPYDITKATIYSDSAYIVNSFKEDWHSKWKANGWRTTAKTPVKNQDLWEQILEVYERIKTFVGIAIEKVEGHSDNIWNQMADELAVAAREHGAKEIQNK